MHNLKQIQTRFDRAAESYDSHADLQQQVLRQTVELAEGYIKADDTVLDAGCGTGRLLSLTKHKDLSIISLDLAHSMCKQTASRKAVTGDFHTLPINDGSVDVYFSSLAWQWSGDLKASSAEAFRTLKHGGLIAVSTLVESTLNELQSSFEKLDGQQRSLSFLPYENYVHSLEDAGFEITSSEQTSIKRRYNSVRDLLHSIKGIGASHSPSTQPISKAMLAELEILYPKQSGETIATWQVATIIARKPAG